MPNQKISTYLTEAITLIPNDRFDVSKEVSPGVFDTQYLKYSTILTNFNSDLSIPWENVLSAGNETGANDAIWSKTGTASSTGTQEGSRKVSFQNSLWDGAAEQVRTFDIYSTASVSINEATNLLFDYNGATKTVMTQDGDWGFGTTSPSAKIEVVGNTFLNGRAGIGVNPSSTVFGKLPTLHVNHIYTSGNDVAFAVSSGANGTRLVVFELSTGETEVDILKGGVAAAAFRTGTGATSYFAEKLHVGSSGNVTAGFSFEVSGGNTLMEGVTVSILDQVGLGWISTLPKTATQASAITPFNGMMQYVSNTNGTFTSPGFWKYEEGVWLKFNT